MYFSSENVHITPNTKEVNIEIYLLT